jgi:hypothetical protein
MRKELVLIMLILVSPCLILAQGAIGIHADPEGMTCNIDDSQPGLITIYVVHKPLFSNGAMGISFSAPIPPCAVLDYVGEEHVFPLTTGDSQNGITVFYGSQCLWGSTLVLIITLQGYGQTPECCFFPIPNVSVVKCNGETESGLGMDHHTINGNASCDCAIPIEQTTWGKIKALYVK